MTYIYKNFDLDKTDHSVHKLDGSGIVIKVKNPIFGVHDFHGVPMQPHISGVYHEDHGLYDEEEIIAFPLIPQYFHNTFEIFSKILKLKRFGHKFKVIFVYHNNAKRVNGLFDIMSPTNRDGLNAAHIYDFFEKFDDIEYACYTVDEFVSMKARAGYVYLTEGYYEFDYNNKIFDDLRIRYDDKWYEVSHFLKIPPRYMLENWVSEIRSALMPLQSGGDKKIYISRKKANDRKFNQEEILEKFLISIGYESVLFEDIPLIDQINLISSSSRIVCLYGSALVNCSIFASSNTKIFAINPTSGYFIEIYHTGAEMSGASLMQYNISSSMTESEFDILKKSLLDWEVEHV